MPSHASSGIRFTRPRSRATLNSGSVVHVEEAQKVTPWKNYLVETKPPIGFFARPPVTPCRGQSEPSFCFTPRARSAGLSRPDATGHFHFALTVGNSDLTLNLGPLSISGGSTERRMPGASRNQLERELSGIFTFLYSAVLEVVQSPRRPVEVGPCREFGGKRPARAVFFGFSRRRIPFSSRNPHPLLGPSAKAVY